MVCNYFPFQGFQTAAYYIGNPASNCSRAFPLKSGIFENLCAARGIHQHQPVARMIFLMCSVIAYTYAAIQFLFP